jgi:hypothetical protein
MRRGLAGVGAALVLAGVVVTAVPGLDPGISRTLPPSALTALGALAALAGVAVVVHSPSEASEPEDVTDPAGTRSGPDVDVVGAGFDRALADVERLSATRLRESDGPAYLRDRLRRAAVVTVARDRGVDHDRAADLVEDGTWTDDPVAAAFLSRTREAPPRIRLREALSTTPRAVTRARRTAAELEDRL